MQPSTLSLQHGIRPGTMFQRQATFEDKKQQFQQTGYSTKKGDFANTSIRIDGASKPAYEGQLINDNLWMYKTKPFKIAQNEKNFANKKAQSSHKDIMEMAENLLREQDIDTNSLRRQLEKSKAVRDALNTSMKFGSSHEQKKYLRRTMHGASSGSIGLMASMRNPKNQSHSPTSRLDMSSVSLPSSSPERGLN